MNYVVKKDKNKMKLAQYFHACAFPPAISSLQECAQKGDFLTWPGIEDLNFKKLLGNQEATLLGHLDQERKYLQFTILKSNKEDTFPKKIDSKTNEWFYNIYPLNDIKTYTDLTGNFPFRSSR